MLQTLIILATTTSLTAAVPLFAERSILQLRLDGDIAWLLKQKDSNDELEFELHHGEQSQMLKIRLRGRSRRHLCEFPPLRLNFRKAAASETVFAGQDKIKLVTHCRNLERAEKDLLEEYAAYQMFSLLSDASFSTRLARIDYGGDIGKRYAFFLEPAESIAARLGAEHSSLPEVARNWLDADQAALVYIFAYMIGNTDWSLVTATGERSCCHNGELFEGTGKILLVPYDFDLSGFVDAAYAKPDPSLRISDVTARRYRGYCTSKESLAGALQKIVDSREALLGVVEDLPLLSDKDKSKKLAYLEKFFNSAKDPKKLLKRFDRRCL